MIKNKSTLFSLFFLFSLVVPFSSKPVSDINTTNIDMLAEVLSRLENEAFLAGLSAVLVGPVYLGAEALVTKLYNSIKNTKEAPTKDHIASALSITGTASLSAGCTSMAYWFLNENGKMLRLAKPQLVTISFGLSVLGFSLLALAKAQTNNNAKAAIRGILALITGIGAFVWVNNL